MKKGTLTTGIPIHQIIEYGLALSLKVVLVYPCSEFMLFLLLNNLLLRTHPYLNDTPICDLATKIPELTLIQIEGV